MAEHIWAVGSECANFNRSNRLLTSAPLRDSSPMGALVRAIIVCCYFFKSARKLGVVIMPICACLETIVAVPGEPVAP